MLKRYKSIAELIRDLRSLKRAARVAAAADDDIKQTTMRGGKRTLIQQLQPSKVSRQQTRDFTKGSKQLAKLIDQHHTINNILVSLNTEFKAEDYPNLDKMRTIAERIAKNITTKIEQTKQQASEDAKAATPPMLLKLANNVHSKLNTLLAKKFSKSETVNLVATVKNTLQYSIYLIYHHLRNDTGHISEQKIFTLSQQGGQIYINPALDKVRIPGQFPVGYAIDYNEKSSIGDLTNKVMLRINAELEEENHISQHALPMPVDINELHLTEIPAVANSRMNGNVLQVSINKSITDKAKAAEITNTIYRQLYSSAIAVMPKIRILHTLDKTKTGFLAKFTFVPTGKFSGRTMGRDMQDKLREIGLNEKDIAKVRYLIET